MAHYKLADNQVMYLNLDGSKVPAYASHRGAWIPSLGFLHCCTSGPGAQWAIGWMQHDGVFCPIKKDGIFGGYELHQSLHSYGTNIIPVSKGPRWGLIYDAFAYDVSWLQNSTYDVWYENGISAQTYGQTWVIHTEFIRPVARGEEGYALATGVVQYYEGGQWIKYWELFQTYDDNTHNYQQLTTKLSLCERQDVTTGPYAFPWPVISDAGEDVYYICFSSGKVAKYDYANKTLLYNSKVMDDFSSYQVAYTSYVKEYNIFWTIAFDASAYGDNLYPYYLKVYANEGHPTQLSKPTALGPIARLTKTTFQTRLLGAQDDAIEGAQVAWSIASGPGTLLQNTSITDSDGYATVEYLGPDVLSEDVVIHAEVAC